MSRPSRQVAEWAARQLADYDAGEPGMLFAEGVTLSVAEGYAVQAAVADLRRARGEKVVGYKVGCTSASVRSQLGIDHCVCGRVYESEMHHAGVTLSCSGFANPAIEGELAVRLGDAPTEDDDESEGLPSCVERVIPVIELHNMVMRGDIPSTGELVANNAIHAGFVAGIGMPAQGVPENPSLSIHVDGRLAGGCVGDCLLETVRNSIRWLNGFLRDRDEQLEAGQIILTGSIPSLIPVAGEHLVRVDAPPFGSVDARFVV